MKGTGALARPRTASPDPHTSTPVEFAITVGVHQEPEAAATMLAETRRLEAELLGPGPTALERLLVERILASWYRMRESDTAYTAAHRLAGTA